MRLFTEEYLAHHGILGQKWGQRNGPPYPLDYKAHSAAEKKQMDSKSKSSEATTLERGKQFTDKWLDNIGSAYISKFDSETLDVQRRFFRDGSYKDVNIATFLKGYMDEMGHKPAEYDVDQNSWGRGNGIFDLKDINPGYGEPGTTVNCTKCAAAVEMNYRGFGVCAGRSQYPANGGKTAEYWFKGAKTETVSSSDLASKLLSMVDKDKGYASGQLCFAYNESSGHAVHWRADKNGNITVDDGQCARKFRSLDQAWGFYAVDKSIPMKVTRWDNCAVDWDHMVEDNVLRTTKGENRVLDRPTGKLYAGW